MSLGPLVSHTVHLLYNSWWSLLFSIEAPLQSFGKEVCQTTLYKLRNVRHMVETVLISNDGATYFRRYFNSVIYRSQHKGSVEKKTSVGVNRGPGTKWLGTRSSTKISNYWDPETQRGHRSILTQVLFWIENLWFHLWSSSKRRTCRRDWIRCKSERVYEETPNRQRHCRGSSSYSSREPKENRQLWQNGPRVDFSSLNWNW